MAGRKKKAGSQRGRPKRASRAGVRPHSLEEHTVPQGEIQHYRFATETGIETPSSRRGRRRQRRSVKRNNLQSLRKPRQCSRSRRRSGESSVAGQTAFTNGGDIERGEDNRGAEEGIFNEGEYRDESYDSEDNTQLYEEGITVSDVVATRDDTVNEESLSRCVSNLAATIQILIKKVDNLEKNQLDNQVRDNPQRINNQVYSPIQDDLMRDGPPRDISTQVNSPESGQSVRFKNVEINNKPVLFAGGLRLGYHLPRNTKQKYGRTNS